MVQKVRYRVLTFFVPFVSTCFFLQHLQLQQSHDWPSLVFYLRTLLAFLQRRVLPLDLSMPLPYYMLREGKGRRFYWISFCNISPEPVDKAPRQANRPNRGPSRGRRGREAARLKPAHLPAFSSVMLLTTREDKKAKQTSSSAEEKQPPSGRINVQSFTSKCLAKTLLASLNNRFYTMYLQLLVL